MSVGESGRGAQGCKQVRAVWVDGDAFGTVHKKGHNHTGKRKQPYREEVEEKRRARALTTKMRSEFELLLMDTSIVGVSKRRPCSPPKKHSSVGRV